MGILDELGKCFLPSHEAFVFMWALLLLGMAAIAITIERWVDINRRSDYDAPSFFERIRDLLSQKRSDEAYQICLSSGKRALPRILGAGIRKAGVELGLVQGAMTEESVHMASRMEKRLSLLIMFGNVSTLLGLLGTVFGLIMAFAAVGKMGVAPTEKSALLASGISAAMNSTLVGLTISIPCLMAYAVLRSKVDAALQEIDRYAIALLKILNPPTLREKKLMSIGRTRDSEEVADTDVTPMLNLMVMLIPFLLTSSEFVKIGAIEMKLPESTKASAAQAAAPVEEHQGPKLNLGVVITSKGFGIFDYFKESKPDSSVKDKPADIPLVNGEYDFQALNDKLADIKKRALYEIVRRYSPDITENTTLVELNNAYQKLEPFTPPFFADNESIKIVAEEQVKYKTVVAVMDASRGYRTPGGNVTMFPNVSIAGGIVQ
jgi:biopolymer transport protein ExbB/TolQ/biopolymer transport protein ExbD